MRWFLSKWYETCKYLMNKNVPTSLYFPNKLSTEAAVHRYSTKELSWKSTAQVLSTVILQNTRGWLLLLRTLYLQLFVIWSNFIQEFMNQKRDVFRTLSILQRHHVYFTLKRRGKDHFHHFHVVSTWNTRGVFVGNHLR